MRFAFGLGPRSLTKLFTHLSRRTALCRTESEILEHDHVVISDTTTHVFACVHSYPGTIRMLRGFDCPCRSKSQGCETAKQEETIALWFFSMARIIIIDECPSIVFEEI